MLKLSSPVRVSVVAVTLCLAPAVILCIACSATEVTRSPGRQSDPGGISICELLKDVKSYRDQVVTVRGIYWHGLRQQCAEPLVTHGHEWPSAIYLTGSDSVESEQEGVPFKTDLVSWDRLDEIVKQEGKKPDLKEIWVTVTGKLLAPKAYVLPGGEVVGGYGHLGVFPAALVIERIVNVEVRANPTYDYGQFGPHP